MLLAVFQCCALVPVDLTKLNKVNCQVLHPVTLQPMGVFDKGGVLAAMGRVRPLTHGPPCHFTWYFGMYWFWEAHEGLLRVVCCFPGCDMLQRHPHAL